MRKLDLVELEIFQVVAQTGSVTRASEALGRVPSSVSTRLRQLEARLGASLFERRNGRLSLSAQGKLLFPYADQILRMSSEATAAVKSGVPRGVLRLGSLESTAAARLPPVLLRFHSAYPDVQVELSTDTSAALVARVHASDIEAAFVAEPFPARDLEMQHVFNERLVLITPQSVRTVRSPTDLERLTVIGFATGCSYRRRLEEWFASAGCVPARVLETESYHSLFAYVAAGTGVAFAPYAVLKTTLAAGGIRVHPLPARVARTRTQLVWRHGHHSLTLDALRRAIPRPSSLARDPALIGGGTS